MNLTEYEEFVNSTWIGSEDSHNKNLKDLFICTAGLGGETGEVLEKLKKYVRDGTLDIPSLEKELGDVLYYLTTITRIFGLSLESVMNGNVEKLTRRLTNGTMRGSGDNR